MAIENLLYLVVGSGLILTIIHVLTNVFATGVREIRGPLAAKISNLYRLWNVSKGRNHEDLIALHEKFGDDVRLGPRVVSIRNLENVNRIYNVKQPYAKSEFYVVQQQLVNGRAAQTLFTTINERFHASIKRPISNAYSMSTLTDYEPLVDRSILTLFEELDRRYLDSSASCPLFDWLQYYAFDVIGELTCSEPFGFLRTGQDVYGIIAQLNSSMDYNAVVGQMPALDHILKKNPIVARLTSRTGPVAKFAHDKLKKRLIEEQRRNEVDEKDERHQNLDFVDKFFRAQDSCPEIVDDAQILSYMITNMFDRSDTTAISLRAIIYYVLKHPSAYEKLVSELDAAYTSGRIAIPIAWHQSQQLPYFKAVVQEALRLYPAVGLILERVVPSGGLALPSGSFLPAGTIVGASPWVVHRNTSIFGADADDFKPERWLQAEGEDPRKFDERLKAMNGATLTFGKGHRTCIGKNISLLEIYKLLTSFFLTYEVCRPVSWNKPPD
ncbi:hypothetical protein FDECE_4618 [Fusarium decemcellulare]|nr:hypothetical protein FDECE_4618 [Fusarium decemcellulare]